MKSASIPKINRIVKIEELLLAAPHGLTQADLAHKLGVHRSTIYRDQKSLPVHIYEENGRLFVDRQSYLLNVHMTLHEAMAVHLAVRLLTTRMERQNPHAASAIRKLGMALESLAPCISRHLESSAEAIENDSHRQDPLYLGVMEKLTLAWAEQRKVAVWHRREDGQVTQYVFAPYFIEPYAIGQSTYLIGLREPPGALRTLKVERLERVELLKESYQIPADFDPQALLADAWGIWYTEEEPVEVKLRFSRRVAHRVVETRWHRSERVEELADGRLVWQGRIAEPLEMMNWIRGWGADVEVLEPAGLRQAVMDELRKAVSLYEIQPNEANNHV